MISTEARPLIEASVPVLREHGVNITTVFYNNMFAAHPELKNLFNISNQAIGDQQQALASAVYAFAANVDQPEVLDPVLNRIAHKHASLGIRSEQYTIVGKYLLGAIAEVLGGAATKDLLIAWDEAYWIMAGNLIAREAKLYCEKQVEQENFWKTLKVVRRVEETADIVSLYLATKDLSSPGSFVPGQYVSVCTDIEAINLRQIRQYSLSSAPDQDYWRITIKKERGTDNAQDGLVSSQVHTLAVGDELQVSPAYGDFQLQKNSNQPVVLLAAGVGITPMMSIMQSLAKEDPSRHITLAFAGQSSQQHPFQLEIAELAKQFKTFNGVSCYEQGAGQKACYGQSYPGWLDLHKLESQLIHDEAEYYLCGPLPFMRAQRRSLLQLGVNVEQIRYEVFGPDLLSGLA